MEAWWAPLIKAERALGKQLFESVTDSGVVKSLTPFWCLLTAFSRPLYFLLVPYLWAACKKAKVLPALASVGRFKPIKARTSLQPPPVITIRLTHPDSPSLFSFKSFLAPWESLIMWAMKLFIPYWHMCLGFISLDVQRQILSKGGPLYLCGVITVIGKVKTDQEMTET